MGSKTVYYCDECGKLVETKSELYSLNMELNGYPTLDDFCVCSIACGNEAFKKVSSSYKEILQRKFFIAKPE